MFKYSNLITYHMYQRTKDDEWIWWLSSVTNVHTHFCYRTIMHRFMKPTPAKSLHQRVILHSLLACWLLQSSKCWLSEPVVIVVKSLSRIKTIWCMRIILKQIIGSSHMILAQTLWIPTDCQNERIRCWRYYIHVYFEHYDMSLHTEPRHRKWKTDFSMQDYFLQKEP